MTITLTLETISSVNKDTGDNEWKHLEMSNAKTIIEHQIVQLHQAAVNKKCLFPHAMFKTASLKVILVHSTYL